MIGRSDRRGPLLATCIGSTAVVATAVLAFGVSAASATALTCGQKLTESVKLTANLTACAGNGLEVAASGITINLNGHTVSGSGEIGVFDNGYSEVTLENGTIKGFEYGAAFGGVGDVVHDVKATGDKIGILVEHSSETRLTENTVSNEVGAGIGVFTSTQTTLTHNTANFDALSGVQVVDASETHIAGNVVNKNGFAGINLVGVHQTVIEDNDAKSNGEDGIALQSVEHSGGATSHAELIDNTTNGNSAGIGLYGASDVALTNNTANDNTLVGLWVVKEEFEGTYKNVNTTITNQTANDDEYGVIISGESSETSIAHSTANGNKASGIAAVDDPDLGITTARPTATSKTGSPPKSKRSALRAARPTATKKTGSSRLA